MRTSHRALTAFAIVAIVAALFVNSPAAALLSTGLLLITIPEPLAEWIFTRWSK